MVIKACFRVVLLVVAICLMPVLLMAQGKGMGSAGQPNLNNPNPYPLLQNHWLVAGRVATLQGDPVRGAKVSVEPAVAAEFRTLVTDAMGDFSTEYALNSDLVKEFSATLTVTKKGFLKAHALADYGASNKTWVIPVTLRDPQEDPSLLSLADLISGLGPRLKRLEASARLSAKEAKEYAEGIGEFLDRNRPDRAVPHFTKVRSRDPVCVECRTMLALAELGWGDWDDADNELREAVNAIVADQELGRPEPLVAYGVLHIWRREPDKAGPYFLEAIKYAPQDALALQELGRSQLLTQNHEAANDSLRRALAAGAGPEARLLRVEALLGIGYGDEASAEMTRYLDGRDVKTMPLRVREIWGHVQERQEIALAYVKAKPAGDLPIDYLRHPPAELQGLDPATDQGPLPSILNEVGKNVAEFVRSFPNTSSLERIHQEKLRRKGKASETQDQSLRYLCLTSPETRTPLLTEYRSDSSGNQSIPGGLQEGFMLTLGFASAEIVFHPAYQSESTFRYLGRQNVNGRDTFVVAFAQLPARARVYGTFKLGETSMTTFAQGLAWIDSGSYQIVLWLPKTPSALNHLKLARFRC